jgi:hypothetical protein
MAKRKRSASRAGERKGDWLRREGAPRARRWALEEQLLGQPGEEGADQSEDALVAALAGRLAEERSKLARLEVELAGRAERVAELAQQLEWLSDHHVALPAASDRNGDRLTIDPRPAEGSLERDLWIRRCEGFLVDSPEGRVGVVEGLRFGSSVERPDLLEVRAGRLRPRLIIVPVEQVERIFFDEGRIELGSDPVARTHLFDELIARLRMCGRRHRPHPASRSNRTGRGHRLLRLTAAARATLPHDPDGSA